MDAFLWVGEGLIGDWEVREEGSGRGELDLRNLGPLEKRMKIWGMERVWMVLDGQGCSQKPMPGSRGRLERAVLAGEEVFYKPDEGKPASRK